jgi:hypothetical protein
MAHSDHLSWPMLATNYYDQSPLTAVAGLYEHDSGNYGVGAAYRGNATTATTPGGTTYFGYDITGRMVRKYDNFGHSVNIDPAAGSNNTSPAPCAPTAIPMPPATTAISRRSSPTAPPSRRPPPPRPTGTPLPPPTPKAAFPVSFPPWASGPHTATTSPIAR